MGYSLDKINSLLHESSITVDLNETLVLHLQALEKEKERIELSMTAIKRVIKLLEEEVEVDSTVLFSLINNMHTETMQKEWMERNMLSDIVEGLSKKSAEEIITLAQTFIQLAKEVKQLYGKPVEEPDVQDIIKTYIEASFAFLGEDLMKRLAITDVEELDIQELEDIAPSPFTEDEQEWLNQAMEYYMKQTESE